MAGFSDSFEIDLNKLIFNALAITNVADNAASAPLTNLWVALHTADPADTGTQGTNEGGYTAYTRISVARTTAGWVCSTSGNGSVSPVANIDFPQVATTSTGTFTHASIGVTSASTSGKIIASGTISPNINFSQNVTPRLTTASSFTLD
jgi:hypothetical protein